MKFLVDRCAGRKLADWLSSGGHDSVYAGSLGPDLGDRALLQRAVSKRGYWLQLILILGALCIEAVKCIAELFGYLM